MSFKKIRDLTDATSFVKEDLLPVADSSGTSTNKITAENFINAFTGSTSSLELDANGNLRLKPGAVTSEQLDPEALTSEDASISNATSSTQLEDLDGTSLSISSTYFGKIGVLVITDHPAANDLGTTAREVTFTSGVAKVDCTDHGFGHPTNTTRHEVNFYTPDGELPTGLVSGQPYWVAQSSGGKDGFFIYSSSTAGTPITVTSTGSGTIYVSRKNVFALTLNNSGTTPNIYDAVYGSGNIVCLNNVFKTVEGAYSWCLRNNVGNNLEMFFGSSTYPDVDWNAAGSATGRFAADKEFLRFQSVSMSGNTWNSSLNSTKIGPRQASAGAVPGHFTQDLCRVRIHVTVTTLNIWFRGASYSIKNINFIYDGQNSASTLPYEFFRGTSELGTLVDVCFSFDNHVNANLSNPSVLVSGGPQHYMTGSVHIDLNYGNNSNWAANYDSSDIKMMTTIQGGQGYAFPNYWGTFTVKSPNGSWGGGATAFWLYVQTPPEVAVAGNATLQYATFQKPLLHEHYFKPIYLNATDANNASPVSSSTAYEFGNSGPYGSSGDSIFKVYRPDGDYFNEQPENATQKSFIVNESLVGLGLDPDLTDTFGSGKKYAAQVKDGLRIYNEDTVAKLKLLTDKPGGGGCSITLQSTTAPAPNEGHYSIFTGGANGQFHIYNEVNQKSLVFNSEGNFSVPGGIAVHNTTGGLEGGQIYLNKSFQSTASFSELNSFSLDVYKDQNNSYKHGANAELFRIIQASGQKVTSFAENGNISFPGHLFPVTTGAVDLGTSTFKWRNVYSTTGAFNGSDANLKQDIEELNEAERRVAVAAKGLLKKYRLKQAVEEKGEDARYHFGIVAQELQAAFEAEDLDPMRYGIIAVNSRYEKIVDGKVDASATPQEGYEEVTEMSVRYSELLAFIIAAL